MDENRLETISPPSSNPDKISNSMIAIGVYITVATLYFLPTICADITRSYVRNRRWYPSKYFSLNAFSLTFLGIATKIPTDLTSPIEGFHQLAKLSGTILICVILSISIPSLGKMNNSGMVSNVAALSVLVVTTVVDIGIQLGTHNISAYHKEHVVIMVIMMILLAFVVSTAIATQTIKESLERKFKAISKDMTMEVQDTCANYDQQERKYVDRVKENVAKYWLLAQTSNPQFVISRTTTCVASSILCVIATSIMIESILHWDYFHSTAGKSDYKETIWMVLVSQSLIIIVGTIGPMSRFLWWSQNGFRFVFKDGIVVEEYWVKNLEELKKSPHGFHFRRRWMKKITQFTWTSTFSFLLVLQKSVVRMSKLLRFVSVVPTRMLLKVMPKWIVKIVLLTLPTLGLIFVRIENGQRRTYYQLVFIIVMVFLALFSLIRCCLKVVKYRREKHHRHLCPIPPEDTTYVLHLEGENGFVDFIKKCGRKDNEAWIKKTNKAKNIKLIELVNQSTHLNGFCRVTDFDTRLSSPSHPDIIYCWALPVVTLLCIAITLPNTNQTLVDELMEAVQEGFKYIRLVDKNLDDRGLNNMVVAAQLVFHCVDLDGKFFDIDLFQLRKLQEGHLIVAQLQRIAKSWLLKFDSDMERESTTCEPLKRPPKILAADCLLRTTTTILLNYNENQSNQNLFDSLKAMIADILGACLTNLPQAIQLECSNAAIELREETVGNAALLLAEVESLLEFLYNTPEKSLKYPNNKKYIDQWKSAEVLEV